MLLVWSLRTNILCLTLSYLYREILYIILFILWNRVFLCEWRISLLILGAANILILFLWNVYLLTYFLFAKNLRTWRSSKLRIVRVLLQRSSNILNYIIARTLLLKSMGFNKWIFRGIRLWLASSKQSCIWLEAIIYYKSRFVHIQMNRCGWAIHFLRILLAIFIHNLYPILHFVWFLHFLVFTH